MEHGPQPAGGQRPGAHGAGTVTTLSSLVPAWDITDEEISEWQHSRSGIPGMILAGYTAAAIRDGKYSSGRELFPLGSEAYREVTRQTVDQAMGMLAARGMVRKSGRGWYPVVPGRLAPSARRAVNVLLAIREELPPPLAAELDSFRGALDAISAQPPGRRLASPAAAERTSHPARPALAIAAG